MKKKVYLLLFTIILLIETSSAVSAKKIINEQMSVSALSYKSYYMNIADDYETIKLSIDVYFYGDITVGVMDEGNYFIWVSGSTAQVYFVRYDLVSGDFDIDLGTAGKYYVVLDNSDSFLSVQMKIVVSITTIGDIIGIAIGALIGLGAVVFVVIYITRNKGPKPAIDVNTPQIQTPKSTVYLQQQSQIAVKFCEGCGSKLELDTVFCPNCGKQVRIHVE